MKQESPDIKVADVPSLIETAVSIIERKFRSVAPRPRPIEPTDRLVRTASSRPLNIMKRGFDLTLALPLSLATAPLMLVIAVLVKLDSDGPVFYTQTRVGRERRRGRMLTGHAASPGNRRDPVGYGKSFRIVKFRSMRTDAETNGRAVWCRPGDARVTRLGALLRKTHLDELPQLFNILMGDMSFVGPRPERPEMLGDLSKQVRGYEKRLYVKPGLTGLAQIRHRADLAVKDVRKKVRYDLLYIRSWSLAADVMIMAGTVPMMLGLSPEKVRGLKNLPRPIKLFALSLSAWLQRATKSVQKIPARFI